MVLIAAAALLLAASLPVSSEIGLRSEARAGSPDPDAIQLDGLASVAVGHRGYNAQLTYSPRLLWDGPFTDSPLILHRGTLSGGLPVGRSGQLSLSERADYGKDDFSASTALASGGGSVFGRVPVAMPVRFVNSLTNLEFAEAFDGRTKMVAGIFGQISGGVDDLSRTLLPLQRVAGASATASLTSGLEVIGVSARFTRSFVSTGVQASATTATGRWDHQATQRLGLHADAGITIVEGSLQRSVLPSAGVGASWNPASKLAPVFALTLTTAPFVDQLTGRLLARVDALGSANLQLGRRLSLAVVAGAARGVTSADTSRIYLLGSALAMWSWTPWLSTSGGFRALRDSEARYIAFVAVAASRRDLF